MSDSTISTNGRVEPDPAGQPAAGLTARSALRIRPSPTLSQAERVASMRAAGLEAHALSNPTFADQGRYLSDMLPGLSTLLTPVSGLAPLRARLRAHLFSRWSLPEHEVLLTAGAKAALYAILRTLCVPDDEVIILSPHWPSYDDLALMGFFRPRHFHTGAANGFRPDIALLERFITHEAPRARVIILSNPNNPTGRIYQPDELQALLDLAEARDIAVLLDESFSQIVHDPGAWQASVARASRQLYLVNSCSKNFHLQGLRLGLALVPKHALGDVIAVHQTLNGTASSASQHLMQWYLDELETNGGQNTDLSRQWQMMWQFIREQGWECYPSSGTFYFFPRIPDATDFHQRMERIGVFALPGGVFGRPYHDHVRLCFGRDARELQALLARMREALR